MNEVNLPDIRHENTQIAMAHDLSYANLEQKAERYAKSSMVPQNYRGNQADCYVAVEMAERMNVSPLMVMQNLYVVKGKPSWSGQACMAMIRNCGTFRGVRHVYVGTPGTESRGCYVEALDAVTGEKVIGVTVTIAMAKAEGWTSNPKWRNMPELMLAYRASTFFARVHCPEMLMGCSTEGEVEDGEPEQSITAQSLTDALKGATEPQESPSEPLEMVETQGTGHEQTRAEKAVSAFESVGITKAQIEARAGKAVESMTGEELTVLGNLYMAIHTSKLSRDDFIKSK